VTKASQSQATREAVLVACLHLSQLDCLLAPV